MRWDIEPWSQWYQTYFELREGKLFRCYNDNKEQHYSEDEVNIDAFLGEHATSTHEPYANVVAFIKRLREPH
jgi:hypothetical protein